MYVNAWNIKKLVVRSTGKQMHITICTNIIYMPLKGDIRVGVVWRWTASWAQGLHVQLNCSFSLQNCTYCSRVMLVLHWIWHHLLQPSQLTARLFDRTPFVHLIHGWAGAIIISNILYQCLTYTWVMTCLPYLYAKIVSSQFQIKDRLHILETLSRYLLIYFHWSIINAFT